GTSLNDYDVTPVYGPTGLIMRRDLDDRAPSLADRSEFLTVLRWANDWMHGRLWWQISARIAAENAKADADGTAGKQPDLSVIVKNEHLRFYRAPVPKYWDRLRAGWKELAALQRAHGFRLLVAIFPESYQVGPDAPDRTPQDRLLGACAEAGLTCLDL